MESKQTYLRDIRDAINGKERTMAGVSGNSEAKYLKDIADAIRENGGGGHDGNDKVKQTATTQSGTGSGKLRVLLSNSATGEDEVDFVRKSSSFTYDPMTHDLEIQTSNYNSGTNYSWKNENEASENKITSKYTSNSGKNISEYYTTQDRLFKVHKIQKSGETQQTIETKSDKTAVYDCDDITLSAEVGENTWDGTNTSLKAALAAAKNGNFLIVNIYDSDPDDELFGVDSETETINITDITSSSTVVVPMYADKTYNEVKTAIESGLIVLLKTAHRIYSIYGYDFVRGTIIFKDFCSGTYIQNEEVKTDSNTITFNEPT